MDQILFARPSSTLNHMNASAKKLKENMRLDFEVPSSGANSVSSHHSSKRRADRINKLILSSPDVQRLVLESPEMERILNLSNFSGANQMIGGATAASSNASSSSSNADNAGIYNTKDVSEDQEAFVLGFMSALKRVKSADMNKNSDVIKNSTLTELVTSTMISPPAPAAPSSYSYVQHPASAPLTAPGVITHSSSLNKLPPVPTNAFSSSSTLEVPVDPLTSIAQPSCSSPPTSSCLPPPRGKLSPAPAPPAKQFIKDMHIKEELPSAPSSSVTAASVAMDENMVVSSSPINMESQERFKTDRKRARNRVAAQKCRNRKIERIHTLQHKAELLKSENLEHHRIFSALKGDISTLKSQILLHTKVGCKI